MDELIRELPSNNMQSDDLAQFIKKRYVRYKQARFMSKNLQQAIMNRSRLLNKYRKEKTEATKSAYK